MSYIIRVALGVVFSVCCQATSLYLNLPCPTSAKH
jgi:hypothetical protein